MIHDVINLNDKPLNGHNYLISHPIFVTLMSFNYMTLSGEDHEDIYFILETTKSDTTEYKNGSYSLNFDSILMIWVLVDRFSHKRGIQSK